MHYFLSVREVYNHDGDDEGHYEDNERILYVLFGKFFLNLFFYMLKWESSNYFLFEEKLVKKII